MKLHQSGNKIVVTELNPMSDAPRDGTYILVQQNDDLSASMAAAFFDEFAWNCTDGDFSDDDLFGWLPMPVYEPGEKL